MSWVESCPNSATGVYLLLEGSADDNADAGRFRLVIDLSSLPTNAPHNPLQE